MIRRTACLIALGGEPYRNLAIEKHLMDTLPEDTGHPLSVAERPLHFHRPVSEPAV